MSCGQRCVGSGRIHCLEICPWNCLQEFVAVRLRRFSGGSAGKTDSLHEKNDSENTGDTAREESHTAVKHLHQINTVAEARSERNFPMEWVLFKSSSFLTDSIRHRNAVDQWRNRPWPAFEFLWRVPIDLNPAILARAANEWTRRIVFKELTTSRIRGSIDCGACSSPACDVLPSKVSSPENCFLHSAGDSRSRTSEWSYTTHPLHNFSPRPKLPGRRCRHSAETEVSDDKVRSRTPGFPVPAEGSDYFRLECDIVEKRNPRCRNGCGVHPA